MTDSGTACASLCLLSLLQPLHFFSSDQPVSYNLVCTHPPSTTSFLVACRCLSVHTSLVFLRSTGWVGSSHTPSFNPSHSCFAAHLFQRTILGRFTSIFFTSCGQTTLMSNATCPSNIKVCHCGHLVPRSKVFTHHCSCKPSHLSPCLHFKDLLPPFLLHSFPIFPSRTFRAKERCHSGHVLFKLQIVDLKCREITTPTLSCLLLPSASSTSAFL